MLKSEAETLYAPLDAILNKQDRLISGTNIKTINGASILGSGDITINEGITKETDPVFSASPASTITEEDKASWSDKQDTIDDLDTIRSNASLGASAVRGIKVNGIAITRRDSKGIVDLGTVITSHQDISGKQDKLVSGSNIKTINGQPILGSGDIVISGGSSSGGSGAYSEVNHGTSDTTFTLTPNTFHVWDEVASLTLDLGTETSGVTNEYLFQFTSGTTATTLSLPSDLKWANNAPPTIAENMIYQVSILKGLGSVLEFDNTSSKITNTIKHEGVNLVFDYPVASEVTVVFYGRAEGSASSSAPTNVTLVYSAGEQSKAIKSLFNIVSVTPSEDDTYIYTF